ncbi:MAG TPA: formyltransferase family protein [Gemmatimonadaceae bacterium]|nr:formyltransferase family protein [Gemmatimonadaceae bacterium]
MTLALLTRGSDYAERVLLALAMREVAVDAIFVAQPAPRTSAKVASPSRRATLARVLRRLGGEGVATLREDWVARLRGFAPRVEHVGRIDFAPVTVALRAVKPDWLLLADSGVVSPAVLSVPSRGTLNAHPALLPWVRGVSVIERGLERGVPAGATVHMVDAGIDTGPLVRRVLVPTTPHDTLDTLWRKALARSAELLAEVATGIVRGKEPLPQPQSRRVAYCQWVDDDQRRQAAERLRRGDGHELYRTWRDFFGGEELPLEDSRLPATLREPAA